jgi:hypothetical protein
VGEQRRYLKLIAFWAAFMILHYAYEFVPVTALKWLAAVDESFFQHAKVAFFGYSIVNLLEYAWRGPFRPLCSPGSCSSSGSRGLPTLTASPTWLRRFCLPTLPC